MGSLAGRGVGCAVVESWVCDGCCWWGVARCSAVISSMKPA